MQVGNGVYSFLFWFSVLGFVTLNPNPKPQALAGAGEYNCWRADDHRHAFVLGSGDLQWRQLWHFGGIWGVYGFSVEQFGIYGFRGLGFGTYWLRAMCHQFSRTLTI